MSYERFDKDKLSTETKDEILDVINSPEVRRNEKLKNALYGLFDGYLYNDILKRADEVGGEQLISKIEEFVIKTTQ